MRIICACLIAMLASCCSYAAARHASLPATTSKPTREVVTGAPYSATQITDHVQTLVDGTHITDLPQRALLYRDSAGRTRIELLPPSSPESSVQTIPFSVEVIDPLAGYRYLIDAPDHLVHRGSWPFSGRSQAPAKTASPACAAFSIAGFATSLVGSQWFSVPPSSQPSTSNEGLGTQLLGGVSAEGTRLTVTYPVNFMGNDHPIKTVWERWTSTELSIDVLTIAFEPCSGTTTTKLIDIARNEPDPSLFVIPIGYAIFDDL